MFTRCSFCILRKSFFRCRYWKAPNRYISLEKQIKWYYCVTLFRPMTSNYLRDWLTLNVGSIMICLSSKFLLCTIYFNLDTWCVMTNTASNLSPLSHQGYQTIVFDIWFKVPDFSSIRWENNTFINYCGISIAFWKPSSILML